MLGSGFSTPDLCTPRPHPPGRGGRREKGARVVVWAEQGDTANSQPAPAPLTPQPAEGPSVPCCEGQEWTLGILEDAAWQRLDDDCPHKS